MLEYYALAILRRSGREEKGNVLRLTVWMLDHMINGKVEVSQDTLLLLGIERRGARRAA